MGDSLFFHPCGGRRYGEERGIASIRTSLARSLHHRQCKVERYTDRGRRGRERRQMTEPNPEAEPAHDPEVLQLAAKVFDLARQGATDTLDAYVDAGVPVNLCNE